MQLGVEQMSDTKTGRDSKTPRSRALKVLSLLALLLLIALSATVTLAGKLVVIPTSASIGTGGQSATSYAMPPVMPPAERSSRPNAVDAFALLLPNTDTPGSCPAPVNGGSTTVGCT